jgi:DNA-binding transcriptional MerR regulator
VITKASPTLIKVVLILAINTRMSETPLYNIGMVTRLTGIPASTLHAWERRYGFPVVHRTAGGHRLYSEQDIVRLRWVKMQIEAGMSAGRAIEAVRLLEKQGQLFLAFGPPKETQTTNISSPVLLQERLLEALKKHDLNLADQLMREMSDFLSPEEIILDVIVPVLVQIGDAWERGQLSIATEHLASNYLRHRLLMWMVTGPPARPLQPVILACPPYEWHEGSLLVFGVLLRRKGWPVAYLGQNVPLKDLADFISQIHPSFVVLVATIEESALALAEWPKWIKTVGDQPKIAFGGRAFVVNPSLRQKVPGYYLGDTLQEGILKLEALLGAIYPVRF